MNIEETFPKQELTELGFLCAICGLTKECKNISKSIEVVFPSSPVPFLLKAILQLNLNEPLTALDTLQDRALPLDPDNPTIKVLIGFSYLQSGHTEKGHALLKPLSEETFNGDQPSRALALELLAA